MLVVLVLWLLLTANQAVRLLKKALKPFRPSGTGVLLMPTVKQGMGQGSILKFPSISSVVILPVQVMILMMAVWLLAWSSCREQIWAHRNAVVVLLKKKFSALVIAFTGGVKCQWMFRLLVKKPVRHVLKLNRLCSLCRKITARLKQKPLNASFMSSVVKSKMQSVKNKFQNSTFAHSQASRSSIKGCSWPNR